MIGWPTSTLGGGAVVDAAGDLLQPAAYVPKSKTTRSCKRVDLPGMSMKSSPNLDLEPMRNRRQTAGHNVSPERDYARPSRGACPGSSGPVLYQPRAITLCGPLIAPNRVAHPPIPETMVSVVDGRILSCQGNSRHATPASLCEIS